MIAIGTAPSRRNRRFGLIAGTAAAAVAILGGGTVLVNSAQPDGALWGVKEVVFSDAASQTLATSEAKAQIREAGAQIDSSNIEAARTALASARLEAAKVKDAKDRAALEEKIRAAEARAGMPVGSTDLGTSATKPPPQTSASSTKPTTPPPPPGTTVPLPPPPVDIMESPERPTSTTPRPTPTTPTTKPTTTTTTAPPTSTTRTTTRTTTTSAATTTTAVTTTTTPASTEPGSS
ncbi:hypothetical protein [Tsukamurella sp. PLM1]|uniref:hypothetical protein n=1 Tax=Tsukamurella sp. PLM1 TaxID=2929795 RepID=UPI00205F536C|nr:hypothetical protein [Tsukamurella sp. PLM1]BDH58892.1 hypothetical protein MTP03_38310 [Tsukamurella sp. PLM1]